MYAAAAGLHFQSDTQSVSRFRSVTVAKASQQVTIQHADNRGLEPT